MRQTQGRWTSKEGKKKELGDWEEAQEVNEQSNGTERGRRIRKRCGETGGGQGRGGWATEKTMVQKRRENSTGGQEQCERYMGKGVQKGEKNGKRR